MPRDAIYGYIRGQQTVQIEDLTGTSAREFLTDLTAGFARTVEKVSYVVKVAHAGAGGSQTIRVLKGASTVVASVAVTLAAAGTVGVIIDVPVTAANAAFDDDDTLTVDMAASGTAFTAGQGQLIIQYRQKAQKLA